MKHFSLLLPFLCAPAFAQDHDPNRFVPADSMVVMRMGAPAQWKAQFAKTQVAKLFQAATLAPMLNQAEQAYTGLLEQMRSSGAFDADLVEKLVTDYRGDIVFAMQLDTTKLAESIVSGEPPAISMVISLSPAEGFDLAPLAAAIGKAVEDGMDGQAGMRDLQVGDVRLRINDDPEFQVCVPTMVDGHLVMLVGNDLEKQAGGLLAKEGRSQAPVPAGKTFVMHGKVGGFLKTVFEVVGEQAEMSGAPFDVGQLFTDTGLTSLDSMSLNIGADGPQLVADYSLKLNTNDAGLFRMIMVDAAPTKLARFIPAGAENFNVSAVDLGALYPVVRKVWEGLGEMVPMSFADFEAMATEELKIRLKEDLLDHLGTEILTLADMQASVEAAIEDAEDPMTAFAGQCMGVALRDGKKFDEALEKMVRARGMHAARKTEEYQNEKIHRLRLGGLVEAEYCVTSDVLLLAIGGDEASRRNLRAVLDQRASGETAELSAKVKATLEKMPKGWSGFGATRMSDMLRGLKTGLEQAGNFGPMPPELEMILPMLDSLGSDMKRLGIETMISTSYTSKGKIDAQLRW